jgi:hypothetical protein
MTIWTNVTLEEGDTVIKDFKEEKEKEVML